METRTKILAIATLAVVGFTGCSSSSGDENVGTGGAGGRGGASSTGGSGSGGKTSAGGSSGAGGAGGSSNTGGSSATGGSSNTGGNQGTGGSTSAGGTSAAGGTKHTGGATGAGGIGGAGGSSVVGGATGVGGTGGPDAGRNDAAGKEVGAEVGTEAGIDGGSASFDPCPASGDCKVLALGDSITWGINYRGGYRIKLFTHTAADQRNITYVGYDTGNPPDATALAKLGSASSKYVNKHEGHSGWTIQQDDDIVTGKSTTTNDNVDYTGKKVVADSSPNIILLHIGTNDIYGSDPGGAPTRLGTLIDHIVADAPNALLVVSTIIPCTNSMCPSATVNTYNKAVPGLVQQRASAGKHVIFLDMFAAFPASDLSSDQVHPSETGYELMAVTWYTAIKSYLH